MNDLIIKTAMNNLVKDDLAKLNQEARELREQMKKAAGVMEYNLAMLRYLKVAKEIKKVEKKGEIK